MSNGSRRQTSTPAKLASTTTTDPNDYFDHPTTNYFDHPKTKRWQTNRADQKLTSPAARSPTA
jgi:hypothetical protein